MTKYIYNRCAAFQFNLFSTLGSELHREPVALRWALFRSKRLELSIDHGGICTAAATGTAPTPRRGACVAYRSP
jgi:hypothetical protein